MPGIAATASFILNTEQAAFGSLFQVGFAFALGIAFAIITCGPTSGGYVFVICRLLLSSTSTLTFLAQSLQPSYHSVLRYLAGVPLEEGPTLHHLSNLWLFHGWSLCIWNVSPANRRLYYRTRRQRSWPCFQRRPSKYLLFLPW